MTEKAGEFVRTHWFLIAALAGGLIAWGANTAQLTYLVSGNASMNTMLVDQSRTLTVIREKVAGIQAASDAQTARVSDLEIRMRAIEARR